jgi:Fic family protein
MKWNWQQPDWPDFTYNAGALRALEDRFIRGGGIVVGAITMLGSDDQHQLTITLMAQEAVDSSAIEGEFLNRDSVQSSVAKHLGVKADNRRASAAEAGAAELMANLYKSYCDPLTEDVLFAWHAMLMNGRRDIATIGGYRTHTEPMQIISGALHAPKVHYEAPPSVIVPAEMAAFIRWFNASAPHSTSPVSVLARAGIAHLWFETIHPFEDGNGRLGRAIAEKSLAQSLDAPAITALAENINRHRKEYYLQLHKASTSNEIDDWLQWFAAIALEGQQRAFAQVQYLIAKAKLLDNLRDLVNKRQEKVLLRMFAEGPDGFTGGLSAANYQTITDASSATTTRDLAELVRLGALRKEGELKRTRYRLNLAEYGGERLPAALQSPRRLLEE